MAAVIVWGAQGFDVWIAMSVPERALNLGIWVGAGIAAYFLVILVLGIRPGQLLLKSTDS